MKKVIPLILLAVFLINLEGTYLLFLFQQSKNLKDIRAEIRKNLKDEILTLIIVPNNKVSQIHWIRKNDEFIYDGKMFDIVRVKSTHNEKYFYCINDEKEKQLISDYQKKCDQNNKSNTLLRQISNSTFFFTFFSLVITLPINTICFSEYDFGYKSMIIDILSPPPRHSV